MPVQFSDQVLLLVDDEESSRAMVRQMLRRIGFGEVIVAADGYRAIDALAQYPVTSVLTDFRMPGMNGLQLLKEIRTGKTAAARNLPCALLTSHAERHLVGLAIVLDVDTFLAKPVALEVLSKHMGRMFQYRFEPLAVEAYSDVEVDTAVPYLVEGAPPPVAIPPEQQPAEDLAPLPLGLESELEAEELAPEQAPRAAEVVPHPTFDKKPTVEKKPLPEKKPEPRRGATAAPRKATPAAPSLALGGPAPAPDLPGRAVKMLLSEVPENAVLARNLFGAGGTLLLAAGTPFKRRYLKRLEELSAITEAVEHVWVIDKSNP